MYARAMQQSCQRFINNIKPNQMKVIINDNQVPKERPFPKLMRNVNSNMIAMMVNPTTGVVISKGGSIMSVGEYLTKGSYVDFEGSITLSND